MSPKHADCRHVNISDEEHKFGLTSLENVQAGVEEFHRDGIVIFENAIPHNVVEKFYEKMNADGAQRLEDPSLVYNHGMEKNYFSLCPPLSKEWLSQYIWANKHAAAVMEAVIGKPQLVHAGSTITIPTQEPTSRQAVHIDSYHNHHKFPTCIELFMYLHNVSPENGSPEIWPGSYHNWNFRDLVSHGRGWIKSSAFNRRAEHSPPFQPTIPKGSIGIRDLCLWRSGMPNLSDQNCIMLGFTYFPRWYRNPMRITLPKNCRFAMQKWTQVDAIGATEFVDGEINHLDPDFDMLASLNYTQDPEKSIKQIREKIDTAQGREPNADLTVTDRDYWVPGRKKLVERVTHGEGEGNRWNQGNQGDRGKGRNKGRGKDIGRYK